MMKKIDIPKGHVLHSRGEAVQSLEVILRGNIMLRSDENMISAGSGTMLGAFCQNGDEYGCDYTADEDCTLLVYDYHTSDDIADIMKSMPSVAPAISSASIVLLNRILDRLSLLYKKVCSICSGLRADLEDYGDICAELGMIPSTFEYIEGLKEPSEPVILSYWQADLCRSYLSKDEFLRKNFYTADIVFCIGTVMHAAVMARKIGTEYDALTRFIEGVREETADFIKEYHVQKSKLENSKRLKAANGGGKLPAITNALETILAFSDVDSETAEAFKRDIRQFTKSDAKKDKSDDMRRLRRSITENFHKIYEKAFFRSRETKDIPTEVRMLFLFGFVDETLAGAENTALLYKYSLLWKDDPDGYILPAYDWLCRIYDGEIEPSKNEFDNDWPEYLKEQVHGGALSQKQADDMLDDRKAKTKFEMDNMVARANKMTYGSVFTYVPVFYEGVTLRPLEECLLTVTKVRAAIDAVRNIDYGCFYRRAFTSYPEMKVNRFDYDMEVLPYVILMPNAGSRGILWQEIEGHRRTTPAHMVISIMHTEDLGDAIMNMCAQFRWEMCKRMQGVHYSDITDPSLTAEYYNYLQFYKKNYELSPDVKERVKQALKRNGNNYRNVFISEYEMYIKNESAGLPRLNKVARDILFRYCTFSRKYREALMINPQYQPLIEHWDTTQRAKKHTLDLFVRRIEKTSDKIPKEVASEVRFMEM